MISDIAAQLISKFRKTPRDDKRRASGKMTGQARSSQRDLGLN